MPVEVVDYDATWPKKFEALKLGLWPAVRDVALTIEHVGSTAVPGLAAKPVIDIDIVVQDRTRLLIAITRLTDLDYIHRGNLGIEGREAFLSPSDTVAHHLYVCLFNSPGLNNHLTVRDYLRLHSDAASAYGSLKQHLAQAFPRDIDGYIAAKTDFILKILQTAGFSPDALKAIEQTNKRSSVK
ncbi:GrpB family protein [cf. Phormidesmis sp. LEGE 11477]|uniref:GrpB family protein n=1 Tax=cf. Phormidesmis sp. LEGE 11477 TaxID=1828680 RepID=UPI001882A1D4|nr:GrpB family protein [cf. Phormidesmis sp. LEGE 11477]MBE9059427.1 GrpB family protein [cf. Phormidesmis sp. LEGE 11477]